MMSFSDLATTPRITADLAPFKFREIGGEMLLVNYTGEWLFVSKDEFGTLAKGELVAGSALHERLAERNFIRSRMNPDALGQQMRHRRRFLNYGPNLHVLVITLRCNETCVYCHASRADMDAVQTDMPPEIIEKSVDLALQSTSPWITIEFQGGEPLVNFAGVKHTIEYALARNRSYGKSLEFTMVTNLALMDEDKLAYLVDNKVQICTSIDGPEHIHTKQRVLVGGNSHASAVRWIEKINKAYIDLGLDGNLYHVEALLTTTREALKYPKEIVDTYYNLGCRALFLRPIDPFGFAEKTARKVEYDRAAYHDFYRTAVEYMLEKNRKGDQILERYASIFLTKILSGDDPNFLDIRSPGGAAIGQLAYSYDGTIFTSDEGRMMHEMGESMFTIGNVTTSKYRDIMKHPTVRAMIMASIREVQPDCVNCTYSLFCGIQPEHNHRSLGSIHGRMRESTLCNVHKGIQDFLFNKLRENDPSTVEIFRRWTTIRERTHFVQASAAS